MLPDRRRWFPHHVQSDSGLEQGQEEAISFACMYKTHRNIIALRDFRGLAVLHSFLFIDWHVLQ